MWSGPSSRRPVAMRKEALAGPVSTGGVGVAEGTCIEFCAVLEIGKIKPPPAKVLANKNCRRVMPVSLLSFIVQDRGRKNLKDYRIRTESKCHLIHGIS